MGLFLSLVLSGKPLALLYQTEAIPHQSTTPGAEAGQTEKRTDAKSRDVCKLSIMLKYFPEEKLEKEAGLLVV
jgi:hypothetical protein